MHKISNIHLQVVAGLTLGCAGLSFGVVGSCFTVVGTVTELEAADVPEDAAALLPEPDFV